jgi:hypothetical protein
LKHIFGMSKLYLDFKGAKGPKLELDYLRLLYAVKEMKKQGESAHGYFVVMTDDMVNHANQWEFKYGGVGNVEVISASLAERIRNKLQNTNSLKIAAILPENSRINGSHRAPNFGRDIGEGALAEIVTSLEPAVQRVRDENRFPLGIRWDFYGIIH